MGEYVGLFIFLGIILMAFWLLIFLVIFLGYWSVMGALNSLMPSLFEKNTEETTPVVEATSSDSDTTTES